jgi:hypothetical protein
MKWEELGEDQRDAARALGFDSLSWSPAGAPTSSAK